MSHYFIMKLQFKKKKGICQVTGGDAEAALCEMGGNTGRMARWPVAAGAPVGGHSRLSR